ncbi:MAG: hypothetical protein WA208_02705 [Thermoanaerobaculia bacterium]
MVVTSGSYIGYNDSVDQDSFRRGRDAQKNYDAFNPPFDREYVWKIPASQEQQEALYLRAVNERKLMNEQKVNVSGCYLLFENNCGSWAQSMIESVGLPFPPEARWGANAGTALGGLMDKTPVPETMTEYGRNAAEGKTVKSWWGEIVDGAERAATGRAQRPPRHR